MKFSQTLLATTAAFGGASASYGHYTHPHVIHTVTVHVPHGTAPAHTTTAVVTAYVTYCPEPTIFTGKGGKTYTATSTQYVTVTDCPHKCTISYVPGPSATVFPVPSHGPYYVNSTVPAGPTGTGSSMSLQGTGSGTISPTGSSGNGTTSASASASGSGSLTISPTGSSGNGTASTSASGPGSNSNGSNGSGSGITSPTGGSASGSGNGNIANGGSNSGSNSGSNGGSSVNQGPSPTEPSTFQGSAATLGASALAIAIAAAAYIL
ncbi:hypothetical protein BP6252_03316 [Coleophoma cylindrospora]|uniref:Uncharacterized protein n=1 Tax=Coleophoma cylindrospora TaxID=1849047 RepID=A0A3D8S804_9HELO|nr:hypothetical protein BP6252_03316 [Coleophoma cylindrospora]